MPQATPSVGWKDKASVGIANAINAGAFFVPPLKPDAGLTWFFNKLGNTIFVITYGDDGVMCCLSKVVDRTGNMTS
jgi:hypothetical protein